MEEARQQGEASAPNGSQNGATTASLPKEIPACHYEALGVQARVVCLGLSSKCCRPARRSARDCVKHCVRLPQQMRKSRRQGCLEVVFAFLCCLRLASICEPCASPCSRRTTRDQNSIIRTRTRTRCSFAIKRVTNAIPGEYMSNKGTQSMYT